LFIFNPACAWYDPFPKFCWAFTVWIIMGSLKALYASPSAAAGRREPVQGSTGYRALSGYFREEDTFLKQAEVSVLAPSPSALILVVGTTNISRTTLPARWLIKPAVLAGLTRRLLFGAA
jgi:hypothetical protein